MLEDSNTETNTEIEVTMNETKIGDAWVPHSTIKICTAIDIYCNLFAFCFSLCLRVVQCQCTIGNTQCLECLCIQESYHRSMFYLHSENGVAL